MPIDPHEAPEGHKAIPFRSCGLCSRYNAGGNSQCFAQDRKDMTEVQFIRILDVDHIQEVASKAIALLNEIDIVPSTEWSDHRAKVIELLKELK